MDTQSTYPDRRCAACQGQTRDTLTGLLDRWGWDERAPAVLAQAEQHAESVALLLLDLDRFKSINDRFGHQAGDAVLAWVADVLHRTVHASGLVGRYGGHGGDEFLVLVPHTDQDRAVRLAERIRTGLRDLMVTITANTGDRVVLSRITASVGITVCVPTVEVDLNQLVRAADTALLRAKRDGRDRVYLAEASASRSAGVRVQPVPTSQEDVDRQALDHGTRLRHLAHLSDVICRQWQPDVLLSLSRGPRRWHDLLADVRNASAVEEFPGQARQIHGSMLSRTLKRLERAGLVDRVREPGFPRAIRYELTPIGYQFITALAAGVQWSKQHQSLINAKPPPDPAHIG